MVLREHMVQLGHRMCTRRSYLPLLTLGLFVLAFWGYRYPLESHFADQIWEGVCLAVAFFGLGIRVLTVGFAPRGTSGRNTREQKAARLNTTGVYSLVRHPLYLGNFFTWFGVTLFFHNWAVSAIATLLYWMYYERIMLAEEDYLHRKFGGEFEAWASRTPAVVPDFSNWIRPDLPFSLRTVLRREYNTFFLIVLSMTVLEICSEAVVDGHFEFEPMWRVIFLPSLAVYLILYVLKNHTSWLKVPGR